MKNVIKKFLPVILVEYNFSNFSKIYDFLKNKYNCFFYDFKNNKLVKLSKYKITKLKKGRILEDRFKKNSVNLYFVKKIQVKINK
jgi:hypothetical protein